MLRQLGRRAVHWPVDRVTVDEIARGKLDLSILDRADALLDCALPIVAYRRLAEIYPTSRFILTVRDLDAWLLSIERHWAAADARYDWRNDRRPHVRAARDYRLAVFGHLGFDREHFREVFDGHWRDVLLAFRDRPRRLLVFDVRDGWRPLCEFLGYAVPDSPVPWLNRGPRR
jgi:Sulfotransferase domain